MSIPLIPLTFLVVRGMRRTSQGWVRADACKTTSSTTAAVRRIPSGTHLDQQLTGQSVRVQPSRVFGLKSGSRFLDEK